MTKKLRPVTPLDGKSVRFYCCGPTVYGPAHIGNFRTFTLQDLFRRVVELSGHKTKHVRNITDVDDKTIRQSQAEGKSLSDFTKKWTEKFHEDCKKLNLLPPHIEPSAVDHIKEQIEMIETLVAKGLAYQGKDGSVYFDVSEYEKYGELSNIGNRELKEGASETQNDSDEYEKDSVADFALWKAVKQEDGENFWESPWGNGRPGWHIECSAMIRKYLGDEFDLHSGGIDLIFPHHENEIAQSCGATDKPFAHHWFHITHLMVDGGKMSKSLGNLYTIQDLEEKGFTANAVRYSLLMGHYKQPLNFTFDSLKAAQSGLNRLAKLKNRLLEVAGSLPNNKEFKHFSKLKDYDASSFQEAWQALLEDLNTPKALGSIFSAAKLLEQNLNENKLSAENAKQELEALLFVTIALGIEIPEQQEQDFEVPENVQKLAQDRWNAKQKKNWEMADQYRKQITELGWQIKDQKDTYKILPL
jgi:cysteinyl-tRNA synthetase